MEPTQENQRKTRDVVEQICADEIEHKNRACRAYRRLIKMAVAMGDDSGNCTIPGTAANLRFLAHEIDQLAIAILENESRTCDTCGAAIPATGHTSTPCDGQPAPILRAYEVAWTFGGYSTIVATSEDEAREKFRSEANHETILHACAPGADLDVVSVGPGEL